MALRVLPPLLYGEGHAYSLPLTGSGTVQSVSQMTREDVVRLHDAWFKPGNATLVITGDTTVAEIKPKLEALFSRWNRGDAPKKDIHPVAGPQAAEIYLIDKPGAQQSLIIAGAIAPPPNTPQEIAFETLNNVLGGNFSGRLNMNLREEKHWSYGARSVLYGARGQRAYFAYASVQTDKTKESVAEMDKEFREIVGTRPPVDSELTRVKQQQILELPGSFGNHECSRGRHQRYAAIPVTGRLLGNLRRQSRTPPAGGDRGCGACSYRSGETRVGDRRRPGDDRAQSPTAWHH